MTVGSRAAINAPLFSMPLSISQAGCPLETLLSTLMARAVPARNTNVGAQIWVNHRVRNTKSGSGLPGWNMNAESVAK